MNRLVIIGNGFDMAHGLNVKKSKICATACTDFGFVCVSGQDDACPVSRQIFGCHTTVIR